MTTLSDADAIDATVRPQDDLYRHVNGTWLATHEIPADRGRDSTFHKLNDQSEVQIRALITEAAGVTASDPAGADAAKITALYASFMATERIDSLGTLPLAADLELVSAAQSTDELTRAMGKLQRTGVGGAVEAFVNNDSDDPTRYIVYLEQSGLGLPDEAYYREPEHADIRSVYVPHIAAMLALAKVVDPTEAHAAAERVMALETNLASGQWDQVHSRDAAATHNPMNFAELTELAPDFDWASWVQALGGSVSAFAQVVVRQPDYLAAFSKAWAQEKVETWRLWLTWRIVRSRAPYLFSDIVEENFDFIGRTLTGATQIRERWKRGVSLVESVLGEAVGKLYVARHFPPTHKEAMDILVADLIEAYRLSITQLEWMTPATREKALAKLDAFTPKVGYPDRWRDYSDLVLRPDDLMGNVRAAAAFESDYELNKLGGPIDRDEWHMPPQTVNAYYNPSMNEIVFPAAILQPPFFDADANAATNYGAIGAVIGHEIGHGFDDQGSKYDGAGRLQDWWTEADRAEFEQRTQALIAQYDVLSPAQLDDSHTVNGAFTVGENIGDLGGVSIAIKAFRIAKSRQGEGVGVEELRNIFFAWARGWRTKYRDAEALRLLSIDPHSPDEFRCNATVRNVVEFYEAFDVQPGDGMWLDPSERVQIW